MAAGLSTPLLDFFRRGEVARDVRILGAQGAIAPRPLEQLGILMILTSDSDLEVSTTAEQTLSKAFAPKQQDVYVTLADYALELSRGAGKDFKVQPQWRDEFYRRLTAKGVALDRAQYAAAGRYVDRLLEQKVARLAAGDSTAKRRDLAFDAPLRKALEVMEKGQSQRDLFTIAAATRVVERPAAAGTAAAP
jgi:hypothetical protein